MSDKLGDDAKKFFGDIVDAAKRTKAEINAPHRDKNFFKRTVHVPGEPVFIHARHEPFG